MAPLVQYPFSKKFIVTEQPLFVLYDGEDTSTSQPDEYLILGNCREAAGMDSELDTMLLLNLHAIDSVVICCFWLHPHLHLCSVNGEGSVGRLQLRNLTILSMKKLLRLFTIAAGSLIAASACQHFDDDLTDPKRRIVIENNQDTLGARLSNSENGILNLVATDSASGRILSRPEYELFLVAEVTPPSYNGQLLRASYVEIAGTLAFVAYNTEGESYLGGVDVFDISDEENPRLISQAIFPYTDVSAVAYDKNTLYLAEATNVDLDPDFDSPAVLEEITLEDGLLSENSRRVAVTGYVATGVKVEAGEVITTSGSSGGLTIFDKSTLSTSFYAEVDNARDLAVKGNTIAVASGAPGKISFFERNSRSALEAYALGGASEEGARSGVDFLDDDLIFAAGAEGILVLNQKSGAVTKAVELPAIEGVEPSDIVANSVSVSEGFVLMANGAAGLYVGKAKGNKIELDGVIAVGGSANVVKSKGNVIFVATGTGGLKIVRIIR